MATREEEYLSEPEVQRRWISKLILGVTVLAVGLLLNFVVSLVALLNKPEPRYLAIDPTLRVRQLALEDTPLFSEKDVVNWLVRCVMDATSFSHDKYQREAQVAKQCFEPQAWIEYFSAQESAGFSEISNNRTNVSGVPAGYPSFTAQLVVDGAYARQYEFPLVRTWEGPNGRRSQTDNVRVVIKPVDRRMSHSGFLIVFLSLEA